MPGGSLATGNQKECTSRAIGRIFQSNRCWSVEACWFQKSRGSAHLIKTRLRLSMRFITAGPHADRKARLLLVLSYP